MNKKEKLKQLLYNFTGTDQTLVAGFKAFDDGVAKLKDQLQENIKVSTLKKVNDNLKGFQEKIDFQPLIDSFAELKTIIQTREESLKTELQNSVDFFNKELKDNKQISGERFLELTDNIDNIQTELAEIYSRKAPDVPDFMPQINAVENKLQNLILNAQEQDKKDDQETKQQITDLEKLVKELRLELINKINNKGGGSINRQILIGGVDPLTKYTDINFKAGTNVTISYQNNNTTKKVDITFSATGGGGSTRSINSVAVSTIAGSASGTDYVYLCSGTLTITMPTTIGNTNLYTVNNIGAGVITIVTTGGETIDGGVNLIMPTQFTSVDLISNNSGDWAIT